MYTPSNHNCCHRCTTSAALPDIPQAPPTTHHTPCVQVYPGREQRYIDYMEPRLLEMGPVLDAATGETRLRAQDVTLYLPTKSIRAFNEKSLKWANKTIKYKDGGWVFVRGVLDEELLKALSSMIYFQVGLAGGRA